MKSSQFLSLHKTPSFHLIFWRGILWKRIVSTKFLANHPKLYGNCAFLQSFHTRKSGEITLFYAVCGISIITKQTYNFGIVWCKYNIKKEAATVSGKIITTRYDIFKPYLYLIMTHLIKTRTTSVSRWNPN